MLRVAMMPGIAQAKLDSSGMKLRPDRPTPCHHPVHQEGRARHVARRLHRQDEGEQDHDLRQEHHHRADARRARLRSAGRAPGPAGSVAVTSLDQHADPRLERVGERASPRRTPPGTSTNSSANRISGPSHGWSSTRSSRAWSRCCAVSERIARSAMRARREPPLGQRQVRLRMRPELRVGARCSAAAIASASSVKPAAAHRHGRDHRHAERFGQRRGIEHQPVALGQVDHVERDHRRAAERDHFLREHQVLLEVGRVEHDDQHFGRRLARELAEDDLAGHFLVGAGRRRAQ